jgi:hypothetical protein
VWCDGTNYGRKNMPTADCIQKTNYSGKEKGKETTTVGWGALNIYPFPPPVTTLVEPGEEQ